MASTTTVSLPLPSSRRGLGWRGDRVSAVSAARPDPGLSVSLPGAARHPGPGCLPLCQRHRDDLPGENRRRPGSLHRAGQLPGAVAERAVPAHGLQHRRLYGGRRGGQISPGPQHGAGAQSRALLQQPVSLLPPHSLGHSDGDVRPQLALDLRRCQRAHQQCPGASEPDRRDHLLALQPPPRHALGDRGGGLAGHAVLHHELSGRPAGHSQGTLRSGGDRRGVGAPAILRHHAAPPAARSSSARSCCRPS